jgi:hypothetical protein
MPLISTPSIRMVVPNYSCFSIVEPGLPWRKRIRSISSIIYAVTGLPK